MSPRKNSPFINEISEPSMDGSSNTPKKPSIPDTLYHKPDIPEKLMKYNEYRDRVVLDSPGEFLIFCFLFLFPHISKVTFTYKKVFLSKNQISVLYYSNYYS